MAHDKRRRPGVEGGSAAGPVQRRAAPGKRALTSRVCGPVQARPASPRAGAVSDAKRREMVGPGPDGAATPASSEFFPPASSRPKALLLGHFMPSLVELQEGTSADPALGDRGEPPSMPVQLRSGGSQSTVGSSGEAAVPERAAEGVAGPGGPLPHRQAIQASFGRHDVAHIEAHVGGTAADAAADIGAVAYATGTHVAFARPPDLHTAAHEAAHVVQQRGGVQLKDGVGQDGDAYEQYADAVADRVVRGESAEGLLDRIAERTGLRSDGRQHHVQRKPGEGPQATEAPNPRNPNNTLTADQMYQAWLDFWTSRSARAQPRLVEVEDQIRIRNPADFANKIDLFRQGRREALGPEYQAVADEASLCSAELSVMADVLGWLEAQEALGKHVTLHEASEKALEIAGAKQMYTNILMTVLLVGYPTVVGRGKFVPSTEARAVAAEQSGIIDGTLAESSAAKGGADAEGGAVPKRAAGPKAKGAAEATPAAVEPTVRAAAEGRTVEQPAAAPASAAAGPPSARELPNLRPAQAGRCLARPSDT